MQAGMPDVIFYMEDVLVHAENEEELEHRLSISKIQGQKFNPQWR